MDMLRKKGKRNKSNHGESTGTISRKDSPEKTVERRQENSARTSSKKLGKEKNVDPVASSNREPSSGLEDAESEVIESKGTETYGSKDNSNSRGPWFTSRQIHLFKKPPPAEEAAYSGPPRYDWVDIETSAAIKLQAAFRRKKVMDMLADEGHSTAAVRNHARRRKAAQEATTNPAQDFINIFNCCGVDLGLGGGHKESYFDISRELEKARYYETHKEKQEKEEMLRRNYQRKPPKDTLVENVEVVQ